MYYRFRGDFTGLHIADRNGNLPCIEVLFKFNASPDKQDAGMREEEYLYIYKFMVFILILIYILLSLFV